VGRAWEEVLANLQLNFGHKVLEETGSGSIYQLKSRFRNLKDNCLKRSKERNEKTPIYGASKKKYKWHER
jgi:hypothetical protein